MKNTTHTNRIRAITRRINTNIFVTAVATALMAIVTAQPPLFAQEEATFFGRRIGGDNSGTRTSSSRENHVFYNTVWCFPYLDKTEKAGTIEIRINGDCHHVHSHAQWTSPWTVVDSKTIKIPAKNEKFVIFDKEQKMAVHFWENKFRMLYRGTTLPPPAPHVAKTVANPAIDWCNLDDNSRFEFNADGTWKKFEGGNKKQGNWFQTVKNTIRLTGEDNAYFEVQTDGKFIIRHDQKKWQSSARISASSAVGNVPPTAAKNAETTKNPTAAQAIVTEFFTLNKQRDEALSSALTRLSKSDEYQLESLKRRAISGKAKVEFFKEIQAAIGAVQKNGQFDATPLKFWERPTSLEREFCQIKSKRDNGIFAIYRTVEVRFKRAYENLLKRSLMLDDIILAKKIQDEIDSFFPAKLYITANLWKTEWNNNEVWEFKSNGELFKYDTKTGRHRRQGQWEFRSEKGKTGLRIDGNNDWQHWFSPDRKKLRNPVDGGTLARINRD
ncbi:MAG: hypothetical protein LBS59_00485 [Puniceicoccales bacterium]|jgi:hypothetical protein|nr:hypothetical protein [Puniceicoccales bacterium]